MRNAGGHIVFYSLLAMLLAMFISRAALSITLLMFVVGALMAADARQTLRTFFQTPLLWCISLLFLVPLLSGLWSENTSAWMSAVRIKLPLLLFPLAFASDFKFSARQWRFIAIFFLLLILAGTAWTMGHYLASPADAEEAYLRSQTIRTPLEHDHVRFSWLVAFAIPVGAWLFLQSPRKEARWIMGILIAWYIIFLHILAARTGLVAFYIILAGSIIWLITKSARPALGLGLFTALLLLPLAAYFLLPTFQNRVKFIRYDFGYLKDAHFLPGGNDATRLISFRAGMEIIRQNPAIGAGYGDIRKEVDQWYTSNFPEVPSGQRILPSNQWLMYGAGSGIIGLLALTLALVIPFFTKARNKAAWMLLQVLVIFPFLYDIGLEVQFGIFLYCLAILLPWKWFRPDVQKI